MINLNAKILCFALIALTSCKSTQIVSSWTEPNKQINLSKLTKVLVIASFKSETSNRKAEDKMVTYLKGKGITKPTLYKTNK